jgi:hypothetical protein
MSTQRSRCNPRRASFNSCNAKSPSLVFRVVVFPWVNNTETWYGWRKIPSRCYLTVAQIKFQQCRIVSDWVLWVPSLAQLGNSMGRSFRQSPVVRQLMKKFPPCYQTLQFIAMFIRAHCLMVYAGGLGLKIVYPGQGFSWLSSDPSDKWPFIPRPFQHINSSYAIIGRHVIRDIESVIK